MILKGQHINEFVMKWAIRLTKWKKYRSKLCVCVCVSFKLKNRDYFEILEAHLEKIWNIKGYLPRNKINSYKGTGKCFKLYLQNKCNLKYFYIFNNEFHFMEKSLGDNCVQKFKLQNEASCVCVYVCVYARVRSLPKISE